MTIHTVLNDSLTFPEELIGFLIHLEGFIQYLFLT